MAKKAIVIGAGFAGISVATHLAKAGFEVEVLEKNDQAGGRARIWQKDGFTFDMGPSWYWMPDVFEHYFAQFGKKVSDYYTLQRLDPSYSVVFGKGQADNWHIPANLEDFKAFLEEKETGSAKKLDEFLAQAQYKYQVGIKDLVYKPSRSVMEFADTRLLSALFKMDVLQSMHTHLRRFFKHPQILQLMEFPILFLGALPENTPALYSLMNYADISLGTWYPEGGMNKIVQGMQEVAEEFGVKFRFNEAVNGVTIQQNNKIQQVITAKGNYFADVVVSGADYHHTETQLLPPKYQSYSAKYWDSRVLAPSSLLFYLGIDKKVQNLLHHNLFFDTDFKQHAHEIYTQPQYPSNPLFYVSVPSITDLSVAPEGKENMFLLMPIAPDLEDTEEMREKYYHIIMDRLEKITKQDIRPHVILKRGFAHRDFIQDYNSFKGNAYGLANTLMQTAILKPSLKSKKVKNLFFTGQLTVPGPGVPPSLISGQVVAREIIKEFLY
jgi:phytoene desaturase